MGYIEFDPVSGNLIKTRLTIYGVDKNDSRSLPVILDTGASTCLIPPQILLDLKYDLSNVTSMPGKTASGESPMLSITVSRLTAIGETATDIKVSCFLPDADIPVHLQSVGLLGLNFLSRFQNFNISFLDGVVELT